MKKYFLFPNKSSFFWWTLEKLWTECQIEAFIWLISMITTSEHFIRDMKSLLSHCYAAVANFKKNVLQCTMVSVGGFFDD